MPDLIQGKSGVTLIELVSAMAIIAILMTGVLPLSQMAYQRSKEIELRQNLRVIRTAIDAYKKMVDEGKIEKKADESGYPKTLESLVEGVVLKGPVPKRVKFLRRIPGDPMTEDHVWRLRSFEDDYDSEIWGGEDVYDVYSSSDGAAMDGTKYKDW